LAAGSTLATLGVLAKYIPGIGAGLGTIATNMGRLGTVAGIAGVSSLVASAADSTLSANVSGYDEFDAKLTRGIYDLTGFDLSRGDVYEGTARQNLWQSSDPQATYQGYAQGGTPSFMSQQGRALQSPQYPVAPQPTAALPPVQVTLQLDGRVLDERIIDVNERTASSVVEDLQTTTSR
ncbi:MAG: hypothetical protein ACRCYB_12300, partial [Aeromonas veronii]